MPNFHVRDSYRSIRVERLKFVEQGYANPLPTMPTVQRGGGSISGIVTEVGVPVSRRVMLYERVSGLFFGQTQSSVTGEFIFENTKEDLTYFAVSLDENQEDTQYNLTGQDLLSGDFDRVVAS